ncbi:MAG: purine-nucleoside phosphorylase [Candidatus Bipolaricaulota bacterium]|nr:purine-nucleoside phosphorylase [Candidatus Bipolaricaulota bacterium]MBS3791127.1 purine-nucleoside phosphorylase [Candidatus Bipolaricaulota bacterium]
MNNIEKIKESTNLLHNRLSGEPQIGLVLGSGLSESLTPLLDEVEEVGWSDIPHFPEPTVEGHEGKYLHGTLHEEEVLIQQGRIHWYEGLPWDDIIYPIRVQNHLGVEKLIMTNAAGGINEDFSPGDLCLLTDHINFSGDNPLRGPNNDEFGPRFPDMSHTYDQEFREIATEAADNLGIDLQQGVYAMTSGPSYETPAEIRALRTLGADLVGMSTVPEAITANHSGMEVLAISCVTNKAAGMQDKLTHEEVLKVTEKTNEKLGTLIGEIVKRL